MPMTGGGDPLPTTYGCRWCDDATGSFTSLYRHAEREHPSELRAVLTKNPANARWVPTDTSDRTSAEATASAPLKSGGESER